MNKDNIIERIYIMAENGKEENSIKKKDENYYRICGYLSCLVDLEIISLEEKTDLIIPKVLDIIY